LRHVERISYYCGNESREFGSIEDDHIENNRHKNNIIDHYDENNHHGRITTAATTEMPLMTTKNGSK
jgi:hypothetical protein